jgi:hypothetical protein
MKPSFAALTRLDYIYTYYKLAADFVIQQILQVVLEAGPMSCQNLMIEEEGGRKRATAY